MRNVLLYGVLPLVLLGALFLVHLGLPERITLKPLFLGWGLSTTSYVISLFVIIQALAVKKANPMKTLAIGMASRFFLFMPAFVFILKFREAWLLAFSACIFSTYLIYSVCEVGYFTYAAKRMEI